VSTRARIVFAGPLVNYLVAFLSLWVVFVIGYPELLPIVGKVAADMPAHTAGLQVGDRIQSVGGQPVRTWDELTKHVHGAAGQPLEFRFDRGGTVYTVKITPRPKWITDPFGRQKSVGLIGITPTGAFEAHPMAPLPAIKRTVIQQNEWLGQTMLGLWMLVRGKLSMRDSVTGPIGIFILTSEAVKMGIAPLLFLISLFSLSLALFNLFPVPILDGGHLFFLLLEKLRGRPVSISIQERAAQVSLVLLVTLVVTVCINDINRFSVWEKLFAWFRR
jgi:regulator of sigma E protease